MVVMMSSTPELFWLVTICIGVVMSVGVGLAIAGIVGGGTALAGTALAAHGAGKASKVQQAADNAAIAFEKEQAAQRQKEYDEERAHKWEQEEKDRAILEEKFGIDKAQQALENQRTEEDRRIAELMRQRKLELSRPYTDLGTASADSLRGLMTGQVKAPSYYAPMAAPLPAGPISQLPSRNTALAGMPSMMPGMVPVTVPPDAATLADLARRQ